MYAKFLGMIMIKIDKSVGKNGRNLPVDVIKIQNLIDNNDLYTGLQKPLPITGFVDQVLIQAIETFQKKHPKINHVDGRVDPGGATLQKLNEYNNTKQQCVNYLPTGFSNNQFLPTFSTDQFLNLYARQFPSPALAGTKRDGLKSLVDRIIKDSDINDLRWAAYMLATVKHECANSWQPIEEYGKGQGYDYGKEVTVTDPQTKQQYKNVYYGRGYVQLTWESNYKTMDTALGLSGANSLHLHPEKALDADTAYRIMSYGMRNGSFTAKKFSDYISGSDTDYRNARRIINGLDQTDLIKGYAENIEFLLRFCNSTTAFL